VPSPASPPAAAPDGQAPTLGIVATFGWALLVFVVAQVVGVLVIWLSGKLPLAATVRYDGLLVALVTLVTNPVQIVLLGAVAYWRTRRNPVEYLGLAPFGWRDFLIGAGAVVAFVAVVDLASWLAGLDIVSKFQTESYGTARAEGWLLALIVAVVVVGPAGEEILFRGFLFRGWVRPGWPGVIGVIVISLIWAAMHVQYDWLGIGQVFVTGLLLGWIRWRTGSTWLTCVLHMLVNLEGTLEAMVKLGGAGS
jgi:membrane protease YdiL (CAAX protease family)